MNVKPVIACLLTFTSYGTWLHGDERGSRDRKQGPIEPNKRLNRIRREQLKYSPITLNARMRKVVRLAIEGVCERRGWKLRINVRTNHVHCVIWADISGSQVLNTIKAWATRHLRESGLVPLERPIWTPRGGISEIRTSDGIERAVDYVLNRQGPALPEE